MYVTTIVKIGGKRETPTEEWRLKHCFAVRWIELPQQKKKKKHRWHHKERALCGNTEAAFQSESQVWASMCLPNGRRP